MKNLKTKILLASLMAVTCLTTACGGGGGGGNSKSTAPAASGPISNEELDKTTVDQRLDMLEARVGALVDKKYLIVDETAPELSLHLVSGLSVAQKKELASELSTILKIGNSVVYDTLTTSVENFDREMFIRELEQIRQIHRELASELASVQP